MMLGHKSITTTAKYLAQTLTAEELAETIRKVLELRAGREGSAEKNATEQAHALLETYAGKTFNA